jgi:hypothetical protein
MSCNINQYDFGIIRGDAFKRDVALSSAYAEVLENPTDFIANLVFREYQDDDVMPYLTLTATPVVNPDPLPNEPPVVFYFSAAPAETQALPDWEHVAYCELVYIPPAPPSTPVPKRLFNSKVRVSD